MEDHFHRNNYYDLIDTAQEKKAVYLRCETEESWDEFMKAETIAGDYALEFHMEIFGEELLELDV